MMLEEKALNKRWKRGSYHDTKEIKNFNLDR